MIRLIGLSLCICLSLIAALWAARAAGQAQSAPISISQLHLIKCTPPCWIGITPGLTTLEDAKARITAAYSGQSGLQLKDSGYADGPVFSDFAENTIEGDNFQFTVRLNISKLVDGRSEIVQSIGLFQSGDDRSHYTLTVADVVGAYGPPPWVTVEALMGRRYEITLKYNGLDVVFSTHADRVMLTEIPRLYFENQVMQTLPINYRQWKGFGALTPGN